MSGESRCKAPIFHLEKNTSKPLILQTISKNCRKTLQITSPLLSPGMSQGPQCRGMAGAA